MLDVSIVIPCMNVVKWLPTCLNSLIPILSRECHEVILVDDGSTDGTGELCDQFASQFDFCKVIHQVNRGVSSARNRGLEEARGEFILFLDPDDLALDTFVSASLSLVRNFEADVLYFGYELIHEMDGVCKSRRAFRPDWQQDIFTTDFERIQGVLPRFLGYSEADLYHFSSKGKLPEKEFASVWRAIYRRSFLDSNHIRFPDVLRFGEDRMFNCECIVKADRIAVIPVVLYGYYLRATGGMMGSLRNIDRVLENKFQLIDCRDALRKYVIQSYGIDVKSQYQGSLVLSIGEILLGLAKSEKPLCVAYKEIKRYSEAPSVVNALVTINLRKVPLQVAALILAARWNLFLPSIAAIRGGLIAKRTARQFVDAWRSRFTSRTSSKKIPLSR